MNQKEKLIELLSGINVLDYPTANFIECLADYILANGVIVLPCKVGDTVYGYDKSAGELLSYKVNSTVLYDSVPTLFGALCRNEDHTFHAVDFTRYNFGKTVFLTREEAEKALAERGK